MEDEKELILSCGNIPENENIKLKSFDRSVNGGGAATISNPLLRRTYFENVSCDTILTPHGMLEVLTTQPTKAVGSNATIITFHDIGLDPEASLLPFFHLSEMAKILQAFKIFHIIAPGQKSRSVDFPPEYIFPSMDALSEMVEHVCHYYGVQSFVGLGVGLGANILVRMAHRRPKFIDGLILINCDISSAGWSEWAYSKLNLKNIKKYDKITDGIIEYLLWYHLGDSKSLNKVENLVSVYKQHFQTQINCNNLSQLIQSYLNRSEIKLARELAANGKTLHGATRTLKVSVLNLVGDRSPHVDATVKFNGKLDPKKCTWIKFQDAGNILDEKPGKVAEAIKLFVQELGFILI